MDFYGPRSNGRGILFLSHRDDPSVCFVIYLFFFIGSAFHYKEEKHG